MADSSPSCGASGWPGWFDFFRCFRMASEPSRVWLGFLGSAFTVLVLLLSLLLLLEVRRLFGGETSRRALDEIRAFNFPAAYRVLDEGARKAWIDLGRDLGDIREALFTAELLPALRRATTLRRFVPAGLCLLILLWLPWAFFGGAINRSVVVEYATGSRIGAAEAREFAAGRWWSYFWPPVVLLGVAVALVLGGWFIGKAAAHLVAVVAFAVGGLASLYLMVTVKQKRRSTWAGLPVGGVGVLASLVLAWFLWGLPVTWVNRVLLVFLFPLAVVLAVPAILVVVVLAFGRGLMTTTISYEATDTFDAVSRAGDYVLRRPWHLAFYLLVGVGYGLPCVAVVVGLAVGGFVLASAAVWAGFGDAFAGMYDAVFPPAGKGGFRQLLPGFLLRIGFVLLCGLVTGWIVSFVHSFRAVCYALLRKSVDLSDPSEVYVETDRLRPPGDDAEPAAEQREHES